MRYIYTIFDSGYAEIYDSTLRDDKLLYRRSVGQSTLQYAAEQEITVPFKEVLLLSDCEVEVNSFNPDVSEVSRMEFGFWQ